MLGDPILNAAGNPDHGADHGGGHDAAPGRHDLRSLLGQSRRHGPIGVFERRTDQRHPAGAPERPDDEDAGAGAAAEPGGRQRQLLQHRHAAPEPQQLRRARSTGTATNGTSSGSSTASMDALVHGDFSLGEAGGNCLCAGGGLGDGSTLVQIAGIGQTYTVSPTFLIDGTFGWTRFGQDVEPPDLGTNFGSGRPRDSRHQRPRPARERHAAAVHVRVFGARQSRRLEPSLSQRPVVHLQHQRELDEGHARHPVRLRLRPPPDESLAAGARRRPARRVLFRSGRDGA